MCPNYDVAVFQPRTGAPLDLLSVTNSYVAILLLPALPFSCPPPDICPGGLPAHAPSLSPFTTVMSPHRIILPLGHHIYPSQHTKAHLSLNQILLPPCLRRPHHACRIPNTALFPPPKCLLTPHPSCFRSAVCCHHASRRLPSPS